MPRKPSLNDHTYPTRWHYYVGNGRNLSHMVNHTILLTGSSILSNFLYRLSSLCTKLNYLQENAPRILIIEPANR